MVHSLYRHVFPVGVWWSGATIDLLNDTGSGTTSISPDDATGTIALLTNRQHGYKANHLTNPFWYFSVPAVQEDTQAVSAKLDAAGMPHVVGPWGRTGAVGTGIDAEYYQAAPSFWTDANADAIAGPIVANYQAHPTLLGYNLEDDVNSGTAHRSAVVTMAQAIQDADPNGRPAFFVHIFPNNENLWDAYDCKVALTYVYPCGYYSNGTETAEGDFMSFRVSDAPNVTGLPVPDWVDKLRWWFGYVPSGAHIWLILQTHRTSSTSNVSLRTPTDRELRKQFWIAVGEGVKGIFWFPGDNSGDIATSGLWDDSRRSGMAVASELSDRLTPAIRTILLKCERVSDLFATAGGGTSGLPNNYPSAYVSTLQHADGTYYVVVCNHKTSTASVTISSATLHGTLTNLEDGTVIRVDGSRSLPALDGTIFRFAADVGVPHKDPNFGQFTVKAWYDGTDGNGGHWANPDAANYIPVGDIQTHPREVVVAPGGLQAAIDASVDYTTFRLQAGVHPRVTMTGMGHRHFIADNPASPPTMRGIDIYGTSYATQYNDGSTLKGYPTHIKTLRTAAAVAAHRNPVRDIIFRDIDFVSDGSLVTWKWFLFDTGFWNHDHFSDNAAIGMRAVRDVLIERCSATGYVAGHLTETRTPGTFSSPPPSAFDTSGTDMYIHGVFWGNAGIECITIRDVDIAGPQSVRGYPYAIFFDGPRGCVFQDVRLTGKFASGDLLYLTNDDFTFDAEFDGSLDPEMDSRNAWCNVVDGWTSDKTGVGQSQGYAVAGGNNLFRDIELIYPSGTLTWMFEFTAKPSLQYLNGHYYKNWGNTVEGCDVSSGSVTTFVRHDADQGAASPVSPTHPYRSRVGRTIVQNNHVAGSVTAWIADAAGATVLADTPNTESGNTTG